jgi:hypothetical protein
MEGKGLENASPLRAKSALLSAKRVTVNTNKAINKLLAHGISPCDTLLQELQLIGRVFDTDTSFALR